MTKITDVNIYDLNFKLIGVLDSYASIIWRPAYYSIGDCEIYVGATKENVSLLQKNRLAVRNTDVEVDDAGNVIYKNVMIIKSIDLVTDAENGDYLTANGKELKYLLHQRIVWTQTNLRGNTEQAIRQLVNENAISPTDERRKIPGMVLGAICGLTDTIEKQVTGDSLDKAVEDICTAYGYGWEIFGLNGKYVLQIYKGVDRSHDQTERPYVVFSDTYENLYNTDYQMNAESYANAALIGGEGEGLERTYTTINEEKEGLDRYEMFVDARDLSSNKGNKNEIPQNQYIDALKNRGKEKLAESAISEGFSGEVLSEGNFEYGIDFDLGDTVTVINSYGIKKNVMVLSAIESEDDKGKKLLPQFNM